MKLSRPRITPLTEAEWTDEQRKVLEPRYKEGQVYNVLGTLARHWQASKKFGVWGYHVMGDTSTLPPRERELLILRTGWLCQAEYEWGQHVVFGKAAGLTDAEIARIEKAARPTRVPRAFELFARGQIAAARGDQESNEAAVDLLSRAIEADPSFVVAHYTLGVVHSALGNRWKAAAQFRASTQADASYPEPYKALGDLFLSQPRRLFDQAIEAYSKAIELRPFFADAYVGLGDAKAAKSDIDGAIAAYQKALVYNPVNPKVHMSLGKIYYGEKGLYYESVTAYKRAIELDSRSVDARMGLGEVYEEKGLYKEAIEEYRRVIEIDGKHTGAMYNLALVYEKVDPRAAMTQWEKYIELASPLATEKDWVDVARQHLKKLKSQIKD